MMRSALPAIILLLAGCAATPTQIAADDAAAARDRAKLEQRLAGYVPENTTDCIRSRNVNVDIYGDTLVYRDGSARLYKTTTTGGCFGLRRDDIIINRSFNGQLCRGDIVTTVDRSSGIPSGACSYGDFTTYVRDRRG